VEHACLPEIRDNLQDTGLDFEFIALIGDIPVVSVVCWCATDPRLADYTTD